MLDYACSKALLRKANQAPICVRQKVLTFSKALSPPHAIHPDSAHHAMQRSGKPPGRAIFLLQATQQQQS